MLFCVLNDLRFPCPRTHMLHVRKLGEGFIQRGFHYKELHHVSEINYLTQYDILYVSNHFSCDFFHKRFSRPLAQQLLRNLKRTQARIILWNFHTLPDLDELQQAEFAAVHLGEDLYPEAIAGEAALARFRNMFDVLPLHYATPAHPHFAKMEITPRRWDMNFVGNGYKRALTRHCDHNFHSFIRNTPPFISEPQRINSFRQSEVNLVFHSDANVAKGVVVERFAEALSLGGIIFHDHPRIARDFKTVQSVIQVSTTDDIDREFAQIMALPSEERDVLRQISFEAWKVSDLSYYEQAGRILAAFSRPIT